MLATALLVGAPASARADGKGISGHAGNMVKTCGDCHQGGKVMPTVFFAGPPSLLSGDTDDFDFNLSQGTPQLFGGVDIAASSGTLSITTDPFAPATRLLNGEVVQSMPAGAGSPIIFKFRFTAPPTAQPQKVTLYGCAASTDGDGTVMGDQSACATRDVMVFPPPPDMAMVRDYTVPQDGIPDGLVFPDGLFVPDIITRASDMATASDLANDAAARVCDGDCAATDAGTNRKAMSGVAYSGGGCACRATGDANPELTLFACALLVAVPLFSERRLSRRRHRH